MDDPMMRTGTTSPSSTQVRITSTASKLQSASCIMRRHIADIRYSATGNELVRATMSCIRQPIGKSSHGECHSGTDGKRTSAWRRAVTVEAVRLSAARAAEASRDPNKSRSHVF